MIDKNQRHTEIFTWPLIPFAFRACHPALDAGPSDVSFDLISKDTQVIYSSIFFLFPVIISFSILLL